MGVSTRGGTLRRSFHNWRFFVLLFCFCVLRVGLIFKWLWVSLVAVCVVAGVLLFGFSILVLFFLSFVFDAFIFLLVVLGDLLAGLVPVLFLAPCFYFLFLF